MKEGRKENVLFNDALNTFYLRLYGIRHMVKDHSGSERGNPLLPLHRLLFSISSNVPPHTQDSTYHELCYIYLWLCGFRHIVKDHSDSEKGNPLLPHRLLFLINSGALAETRNSSVGPP